MREADVGFKSKLCAFFGIDRSGQYKPRVRGAKDQELAHQIREVRIEHPAYGHRRIAMELEIGKNRARRIMHAYGIPPPKRRKKYVKANKGDKPAPLNLLKDHKIRSADGSEIMVAALVASYPHHIWAEDFTYLWFQNRFYYLATIIDLKTRQIVGWSLGTRHTTQLITDALMDAVSKHESPAVLHNDRGSEYMSKNYRTICESLEITMSASAAGKPWENGFQESFYGKFKDELGDIRTLEHEGELLEAIANQLHYYNTKRIHSALRTNPAAYAARFEELKLQQRGDLYPTEVRDKVMLDVGT